MPATVRTPRCRKGARLPAAPNPAKETRQQRIDAVIGRFDALPADARVRIPVAAALAGISVTTTWRRIAQGAWPKPERDGGTCFYRASELRKVLACSHEAPGSANHTPDRMTTLAKKSVASRRAARTTGSAS